MAGIWRGGEANWQACFGAFDGGEGEGEGAEIVVGGVNGFAVFFDGGEELGHGALESIGEPATFEGRGGGTGGGMEGDFLGEEGGTDAADGSRGTDHGRAIFMAERGGGIEGERGLAAFELDRGLGKKRGEGALMGGVSGGGKHLEGGAVAKEMGG